MDTIILLLAAFLTAAETAEPTNTEDNKAATETSAASQPLADTKKVPEQGDTPKQPQKNAPVFRIAENSPAGTPIGTIPSQQPGKHRPSTFLITGGNEAGLFTIDRTTGKITVAKEAHLNYEQKKQYVLKVAVLGSVIKSNNLKDAFAQELLKSGIDVRKKTDAKQSQVDQTITIVLSDVNEPPAITNQAFALDENSKPGTFIGRITAADPDTHDILSFEITGGDAAKVFEIDQATGEIKVTSGAMLNYETQKQRSLQVTATDSAGLTQTATIRLNLNDVNDVPRIVGETWNLAENSEQGTVVGRVQATDEDANEKLTYQFLDETDEDTFTINAKTGEVTVRNSKSLDFENATEWQLKIRVTDSQEKTSQAKFHINLTNVNEPPRVRDQSFQLSNKVRNGMRIGSFSAIDFDADDQVTYAITGGNQNGAFRIDPQTGEITLTDLAKLKDKTELLEITVTDRAGATGIAQAELDLNAAIAAIPQAKKKTKQAHAVAKDTRGKNIQNNPQLADKNRALQSDHEQPTSFFAQYGGWSVAAVLGFLLAATILKTKIEKSNRRKSFKSLERERTQVRNLQMDLEEVRTEILAEKDELLAIQNALSLEFEKLRSLLVRQRAELDTTETTLHESEILLQANAAIDFDRGTLATALNPQQEQLTKSLKPLREGLGSQKDRLGALQNTLEQRDYDLESTCAAMEARLDEAMQRIAGVDDLQEFDETNLNSPSRDLFASAEELSVSTQEENRLTKAESHDRISDTYDGSLTEPIEQDSSRYVNEIAEPMSETNSGVHPSERRSARSELDTLREVANQSARSALTSYSRKRMWKSKLLLGTLSVASFSAATVLLSGQVWTGIPVEACGWGATAIGSIAALHLFQKIMPQ